MKIVEPSVELVSYTPEPEKLIERMGRICYKSEDKITEDSASKFIQMLLKRGHESVIEHASASFIIRTDRGITHEKVRHRIASYSQESTRYCNYSKEGFGNEITVIPPLGIDEEDIQDLIEVGQLCEQKYNKWIKKGRTPQQARDLLPTCLKSDIGMSANFREWRLFCKQRYTNEAAHPKMRVVAGLIAKELSRISPTCFGEFLQREE